VNVRLQYTIPFTAAVHYQDRLIMNTYQLRTYMVTNTADAENHNIAFERLKYFITEEMDSTVFINSEHVDACKLYLAAGMKITTLPNDPVDQIIGVMLFCKLNAIMEDRITIIETELSSSLGDNMVYIHGENEVTDNLVFPDWWTTVDVVHCDTDLIDSDNVLSLLRSNVWKELDLGWPESVNETPTATGNIVFADFGRDDTKQ
jgi:hypothetical protein